MKSVTVLGSTGSIGTSTLDVIRKNREHFQVFALAAGNNVALLVKQIREFVPTAVAVASEQKRQELAVLLAETGIPKSEWPELMTGAAALVAMATVPEVEIVMSSIVGVGGLEATYEAARAGKRIGLANKESLVSGGALVMGAVAESGAELIPVDSEHNGAHQCLRAGNRKDVTRLILTASGGPFRTTAKEDLGFVTPDQALRHPTWKMGNRITIDSATLMNKGFEVIEACWLFGFPTSQVDVVVHPQSKVHAMVEFNDGSVIAQVCATDMRMPIQYAMTWPERWPAPVPIVNWEESHKWDFHPPDKDRFRLLQLAYDAQEAGGSATCTLNAADEVAVEAFLDQRISFPQIAVVVEETLSKVTKRTARSISDILEIDRESRAVANEVARQLTSDGRARPLSESDAHSVTPHSVTHRI